MNKVYTALKDKIEVTEEDIRNISNYPFSDYMIELLMKDLNENHS